MFSSLLGGATSRHGDEITLPLLQHIREVKERDKEDQEEAHQMYLEAQRMRDDANSMCAPWEKVSRKTMLRRADELEARSKKRKMTVSATMEVMRDFERRRDMMADDDVKGLSMLVNSTQCRMGLAPSHTLHIENDICVKCDVKLLLCDGETVLRCPRCGQETQETTNKTSAVPYQESGGALPRTSNGYDRSKKFQLVLATLQAKEKVSIDPAVLDILRSRLGDNEDGQTVSNTTYERLKTIIQTHCTPKDSSFLKKHIPKVHMLLTGIVPPRLTDEQEGVLLQKFSAIENAFDNHVKDMPSESVRKPKFLDFSFLIVELSKE